VSVATVSKVLNDRYGVSAETTARVRQAIKDLGYEASLVAQSLRNHRTNVIGILVAEFAPFSTELLKGIASGIQGSGYELVVYSAGGRAIDHVGWERRYLSRLSGTLMDGVVLVTPTVVEAHYGRPIVAVDPHTGPSDLPTVDSNNLRGAEMAAEHLLELGHRRIGLVTGRPDLQSSVLRETGFRRALAAAGVGIDKSLVVEGDYDEEITAEAVGQLLARSEPPTAIFAANDVSAISTVEVATSMGFRVPEDLSVVGFDNIPESVICTPSLTTVEQPIRTMGYRAITMLLTLLRREQLEQTHVTLDTRLIVRASTAAVPAGRQTGNS
jgi:LacI family transcriptional regulator